MKFFNHLADFFMMPIESITLWLQQLEHELGIWWTELWHNIGLNVTEFLIEGVSCFVIGYMVYCCYRMIITNKDEKFSEFLNKWLIGGLAYFFAKCGGVMILHAIGG